MAQSTIDRTLREIKPLHSDERVAPAVRRIADARLPALPVVDRRERLCGIFGEREFIQALFPGYLAELRYAGFVPGYLDDHLRQRSACATDPVERYMNTEHIDVPRDASGAQIAETFLHHRVLIVPVVDPARRVLGIVTRHDFFRSLVERLEQVT